MIRCNGSEDDFTQAYASVLWAEQLRSLMGDISPQDLRAMGTDDKIALANELFGEDRTYNITYKINGRGYIAVKSIALAATTSTKCDIGAEATDEDEFGSQDTTVHTG